MKCLRCGNEVTEHGETCDNGYITEDGRAIHHGCSMLMAEAPRAARRDISDAQWAEMVQKTERFREADAQVDREQREAYIQGHIEG